MSDQNDHEHKEVDDIHPEDDTTHIVENLTDEEQAIADAVKAATAQQLEEEVQQEKTPEEEIAELKDKLLRTMADLENTRRRARAEKEDAGKYAISSFARDVLTVSDNFSRAFDSLTSEDKDAAPDSIKNFVEGVEMTSRELLNMLERHGIRKIEPMNEKFDPNLHQAMFEVPGTDQPNGTVVQVVQAGFVIGERLLRPALVGVAKGDPVAKVEEQNTPDTPGGTVDTSA